MDLVDAVLLLPEKLFYNTTAAGIILILDKEKEANKKNKVILINASKIFQKGKPLNSLNKDNIGEIMGIYENFENIEGKAKVVTLDEIQEKKYDLTPSKYVRSLDTREYRDLGDIQKEIKDVEELSTRLSSEVMELIKKLDI